MRFIIIIYFLGFVGSIGATEVGIMGNLFESINVKSSNSKSGAIKIDNIESTVFESSEKSSEIETREFKDSSEGLVIMKFDLLFDERLTEDDPRIKSIIYVAASDKKKSIKISYQNDNARALVNKLIKIFQNKGLEKIYFKQTTDIHDMKNIWVQLV